MDEYEIVKKMIDVFKSTHDIEGYVIDTHIFRRMVELFMESTGKSYEYSLRRVSQILNDIILITLIYPIYYQLVW